jgi:hypothetical protein
MPAHKSGGTTARLREKNSAMAARMKAVKETRNTMGCPMCHKLISIQGLFSHLGKAGCFRR